jgi:ribose transport system permease protein
MLTKSIFGRHIYALGGNRSSAWLSGVKTNKTEILIYVLGGFFSAFAGIMLVARMNYASPTAASNYAIDSIAAVIIGGTAMSGGKGSVLGTLLGAMLLGVLKNGLTMLNVSPYLQQIIIGVVIIAAVFLDGRKVKE